MASDTCLYGSKKMNEDDGPVHQKIQGVTTRKSSPVYKEQFKVKSRRGKQLLLEARVKRKVQKLMSYGPVALATGLEQAQLVIEYAELFCNHINQKFAAASETIDVLNRQVLKELPQRNCTSIQEFHAFYERRYPKHLGGKIDLRDRVVNEANTLAIMVNWWWPWCIALPEQMQRRMLMMAVYEKVKDDEEYLLDTYRAVNELCESSYGTFKFESTSDCEEELDRNEDFDETTNA